VLVGIDGGRSQNSGILSLLPDPSLTILGRVRSRLGPKVPTSFCEIALDCPGGTDAAGQGSNRGDLRPYPSGACRGWIENVELRAR
jgi:hypothetical protein